MSNIFQVCIKHWALRALIWLSWGLCNWKLFYWSEPKLYSDYITLFYCYITDFILAPKLHYVLQLELFHILIRNNRNTTAVFTIVWFRNIPHGKITSRGRPEDVPKNVFTSSGQRHTVIYVTPRDTFAAGGPWHVLRT